jgi:dienelactone hydrolase
VPDDDLGDFEQTAFTHDHKTRAVFRQGAGPAVIVIAEMPGITPNVARFARRVSAIGCTAVLPHLFGVPGRDPSAAARGRLGAAGYMMKSIIPACVSREFVVMATGKTSPVVDWLRALARHEHERCGGPGVGAVGMCFTGGYALAMATDDRLLAPVLSQPSLPFGLTTRQKYGIDISRGDLDVVKQRCASQELRVVGLRFSRDRLVPDQRFAFLRDELGPSFVAVDLRDEDANPEAAMKPHSVLTEHLVDEPGNSTHDALHDVLELFRTRLLESS